MLIFFFRFLLLNHQLRMRPVKQLRFFFTPKLEKELVKTNTRNYLKEVAVVKRKRRKKKRLLLLLQQEKERKRRRRRRRVKNRSRYLSTKHLLENLRILKDFSLRLINLSM